MRTTLAGLALAALTAFGTVVLVARPATAQQDDSGEPESSQSDERTPDDRRPSDRSPEDRLAQREARLDRLVEEGMLSPERAAEIQQRLAERADRVVERKADRQARIEGLASTLGLTADEVTDALRSGSSLAELAADAGIAPSVIIEQLVSEATTRIEAAVADDKLDQARATELLDDIEERITAFVNGERPERRDRGAMSERFEARFGEGRPGMFGDRHPGGFGPEIPGD